MGRGVVRRGAVAAVVAIVCLCTASAASAGVRSVVVSDSAIAGVRFGLPRVQAVAELTRILGHPTQTMINSGCSPRYAEVGWGHLFVEFRAGKLSGFRYMQTTWLPKVPPRPVPLRLIQPKVATPRGISLGSTLRQLRSAYGRVNLVGTDRWQTPDGLIFYDDGLRNPPPASSRIIEIKYGTCGDF